MPRFGWKCFIGSFLFSLAAVWGATKAYLLAEKSEPRPQDISATALETKDIDLFAGSEENNPIVEKFERLNQKSSEEPIINVTQTAENSTKDFAPEEKIAATTLPVSVKEAETAETLAETPTTADEVLYAPDDDDETIPDDKIFSSAEANSSTSPKIEQSADADINKDNQELDIATADEEELQIAAFYDSVSA